MRAYGAIREDFYEPHTKRGDYGCYGNSKKQNPTYARANRTMKRRARREGKEGCRYEG